MSRRDLAHVLSALWRSSGGAAGVAVPVAEVDRGIGRGRDDMRTPLDLAALAADGLVAEAPGGWALTDAGVQRLADDDALSRPGGGL
ncbi:hypothetical protein FSW04_11035 [Baekduia soli]|uniref:Uncharacterized protein n=1 Tax=Baekduia soli TaxID=496014 RepID=A0A5B8U4V5_9ACTN|nr:hypothetical protein [Baekduia soli]QEC48050.1 hypothetical protein FSW04_11035 [Baekduia soli]